ncbi:MAG: hypothetical protein ACFCVD_24005 [Nodosilinea sp.]
MIAFAITLNVVIALFCLYVAWRLWKLGRTLGAIADSFVNWERNTHNVLNPEVVPPAILLGRTGTARLRRQYAQLQGQTQRLRQVLLIVSLLPGLGRRLGYLGQVEALRPLRPKLPKLIDRSGHRRKTIGSR